MRDKACLLFKCGNCSVFNISVVIKVKLRIKEVFKFVGLWKTDSSASLLLAAGMVLVSFGWIHMIYLGKWFYLKRKTVVLQLESELNKAVFV